MYRTCKRCGDEFVVRDVDQRHCVPCAAEVAQIITADQRRRRGRFPIGKDLTGTVA